jgi:signal transduction histidine kinase
LFVLRNITEEIQVSRAKELITETLVHDLRSPASAVSGALDVLEETLSRYEIGKDELVVQALQVARRGAQRMLGMTESLLEISRLQAGKTETSLASINLRNLAAGVLGDFLQEALEYGIILRNEIPEDAPAVRADLSKTTRVLTNLVDNALKFTPSGGQVILTVDGIEDGMVAVQVSDTGPGIPAEYREKIFERFSQIPGLAGRRRGSGLGLTFCRLALDAQGGKIWAAARPGGGSVFTFTLPVEQPAS